VYVLGTGIHIAHPDFGGRAGYGPNFVGDQSTSENCAGGGTEQAGIIGGTQHGVAWKVTLVAVRIFGCNGIATSTSIQDGVRMGDRQRGAAGGHPLRPR
jgi:subtilisin family serine protease